MLSDKKLKYQKIPQLPNNSSSQEFTANSLLNPSGSVALDSRPNDTLPEYPNPDNSQLTEPNPLSNSVTSSASRKSSIITSKGNIISSGRAKRGDGDYKPKSVRFQEPAFQLMPQLPNRPTTPSHVLTTTSSVRTLSSMCDNDTQPHNGTSEEWWEVAGLSLDEAVTFDRQFLHTRFGPNSCLSNASQPTTAWFTTVWARMLWLTLVFLGLQFSWAIENSYGSPYLLSLGLSKTALSLTWLAGPVSGLVMQPLVGALSDKCQSNLGRRRPFLVVGAFGIIFSLISIGWTVEMVGYLGGPSDTSKGIAIAAFFILDFSINTIQAAARALVVDVLPARLQDQGNAWAGRMIGVGNVVGYFMGYLDLVSALPFLGDKQLKVLCFIACVLTMVTTGVTCAMIHEIPLRNTDLQSESKSMGPEIIWDALKEIGSAVRQLPLPIRDILRVQFFAWVGWFPFLFYSTTWVAEFLPPSKSQDSVGETTREGSRAFFLYSVISLGASFLLPYLSRSPQGGSSWKPTIYQMFTFSLIFFAILMLSTLVVSSTMGATLLIILNGIPWAMAMWAPFALIGDFIHRQKCHSGVPSDYLPLQTHSHSDVESSWESPSINSNSEPVLAAGIVLGIHNIAIVAPQLLLSLFTSVVFHIIGSDSSIGWVFPIGGLSALVATYYSIRLWQ